MIGRYREVEILKKLLSSKEPEFLAVVGRRRVGKTYLIRETYRKEIVFEVTGIMDGSKQEQLTNFHFSFLRSFDQEKARKVPTDWLDAFRMLIVKLEDQSTKRKQVVFY